MKIALISPDYLPVPPIKYGGIERVVYTLAEELVSRGHDVTLYAPIGSQTSARLIPYLHHGHDMWQIPSFVKLTLPQHIDIIHDHTQLSVVGQKKLAVPTLCTIHNPLHNPVKHAVYLSRRHKDLFGHFPDKYVYNGLNPDEYQFSDQKDDYLLYMGSIIEYKGVHHAIEVANRSNQKLVIAGPIYDYNYFHHQISPLLMVNPNVQYIGEVGGQERQNLLKKARCMLFPTLCEEPFGLVMIEALACGTPVLALSNGSVSEVMSGFPNLICHTVDQMADKAMHEILPSPDELRAYVLNNFTTSIMTDRYLEIYEQVINEEV
ncbi:glycosyl transferase [Paenibacillus baekrokdamisoli]|uniref:Glycosyl transferase n=1 Tax=Paenibacillus baekrokdamisoli TaxID=1712516 RepID=A0A3G9JCZ9_9BACL|nr:glycosyltransferase family 4 protein [Paenibacillus baekrokdamisoli]MBB3070081.1 glycosyltransferase involved in cell wall biosynthesis [Paenibacillus baekrokdamisoli]BBH21094.1 glycosyl transferase [Paenibacillus baekrokdamisoli]